MFFVWSTPVVDNSPKLSEVKDGKQIIELYDKKLGGMRKVTSTPEKVNEFLKNGYEEDSSILKKSRKNALKAGSIGALLGATVTLLSKSLKGSVAGTIGCVLIGASLGSMPFSIKSMIDRNSAANARIQNFIEDNK